MRIKAMPKKSMILPGLALLFLSQGCSYQEALRGKHENQVDGHHIVIMKPCGLFTENTTRIENVPGRTKYEYICGETNVSMVLKDNELSVNGQSYGMISEDDSITFDHGKVLISPGEKHDVASR
jgi:hypothetical protein